ncbi:MAG TPA: cation transporter [Abditibacteriaceae bacterium]|jgi:copper chaperone CopZ
MQTTTLNITGMSCEKCVQFVTQALKNVPGVREAEVSLTENNAVVKHQDAETAALVAAVEEEGYGAEQAL